MTTIASEDHRGIPTAPSTPNRNATVIVIAGLASAMLAVVAFNRARFEDNLLELQATGLESVEWEHRVLADSTSASWFAASIADTVSDVERIVAAASPRPEIGAVRSVLDLVAPPDRARNLARAALVAAIDVDSDGPEVDGPIEASELRSAASRVATLASAAASIEPDASKRLRTMGARLNALATGMSESVENATRVRAAIDAARERARIAVRSIREGAAAELRDALPAAVRDRLMAPSGRFMVSLVPAEDIWSPEPMARFVTAVREVDPGVTGVPITQYESLRDMRSAFLEMGLLSILLVLVLLTIDFRRFRPVFIAMIVLTVGLTWTIGVTSAFGVHLNVANFFAIPILIGIGIDSAIHMLHRADECGRGPLDFRGTRGAVVLTALTTGIGFGSLVFARHRGLESLGIVMAIGSACCLLSTVILLPSLTSWLRPINSFSDSNRLED